MNNHQQVEIILVEDNPDDARLAIRELKKSKLVNKLIHLKDGEEALNYFFGADKNKILKKNELPKLILLDLKMPKVSGIEVLRELRKNEFTKSIPVVVFTSSKEDKDIVETYKLGVNSYIVKPVDFNKFSKVIKEIGYYWLLINQKPIQ